MADECDIANDRRDAELDYLINEHRYQLERAQAFEMGRCRNCAERLDDGRAYCDQFCRDDHSNRMKGWGIPESG